MGGEWVGVEVSRGAGEGRGASTEGGCTRKHVKARYRGTRAEVRVVFWGVGSDSWDGGTE